MSGNTCITRLTLNDCWKKMPIDCNFLKGLPVPPIEQIEVELIHKFNEDEITI